MTTPKIEAVRRCKKCLEDKALDSFGTYAGGSLRGQCKECERKSRAAYREMNRERMRAYNRAYVAKRPAKRIENQNAIRRDQLEKKRAWDAIDKAVRRGKVTRPDRCSKCGCVGRVEASHHDYSKPMEVEWLCPICHRRKDYAARSERGQ